MDTILTEPDLEPEKNISAIKKFLELYTGKQRKVSKQWMDYFTSQCFLDAAWNRRFASLLFEHVTRLETVYPVNREFLTWLCAAYQFTATQEIYLNPDDTQQTEYAFQISTEAQFDGQEMIFQIAAKGPAPKQFKGNELAMLQSFREYRRLVHLAEDGTWNEEAVSVFSQIIGCYTTRCITDKCQQRGDRDCERHPAGLRLIAHFLRRDGLPDELYRIAWQKLDLQTAVMGRAKIFWGPLRDLTLMRLPELAGQPQISFAKLRTDFHDYAVSTYKRNGENAQADQGDIKRTDAFFTREDFQQALLDRRFVEEEMLRTWVDKTRCDYYLQRVIRFYTEHPEAPCARQVIHRAKEMLRDQKLADWLRKDRETEVHADVLTLKSSPFFRHWLNTGFYQAADPESGRRLTEYLNEKLPFLPEWSKKFLNVEDNVVPVPRSVFCALETGRIEIRFHLRYIDFLLNGTPIYRPCIPWEQVKALADTDAFFFLLPAAVTGCSRFEQVKAEICRRLTKTAAPEDDRSFIASCLAGQVCSLPLPDDAKPADDFWEKPDCSPLPDAFEETADFFPLPDTYEDTPDHTPHIPVFDNAAGCFPPPDDFTETPGRPLPPESALPFEVFAENADHLYGCAWIERSQTLVLFEQWPHMRQWKHKVYEENIPDAQTAVTVAHELLKETLTPPPFPVELLTNLPDAVYAKPDFGVVRRDDHDRLSSGRGTSVKLLENAVTAEKLLELLEQFAAGAVKRLELSWKATIPIGEEQGYEPRCSLLFLKDGNWYACLYFDDFRAKSYALLEKPELYGKLKSDVYFVPFCRGRLFRDSLHRNFSSICRQLRTIFSQANWPGSIKAGGIWTYAVNVSNRRVKYNLDKQLLGDFPMEWAHNRPDAPFYFSFRPDTAAFEDTQGNTQKLTVGDNPINRNRLQQILTRFLQNGFSRLRMTWGKEEGCRRHIVLLQDGGRFLMAWLQEDKGTARFHVADPQAYMDAEGKKSPEDTFQNRITPAYLIHDLIPLRNALDLLLADLDSPENVTDKFSEYTKENMVKTWPYETLRAEPAGHDPE